VRQTLARILLVALLSIVAPSVALACSCGPCSREQVIEMADVAFSERVARIWRSSDGRFLLASVVITKRIKGTLGERVTVTTSAYPTMCGYALDRGRTYDFAAERAPRGMVSINMCSMVPMNP
jgi:hypothetical protein